MNEVYKDIEDTKTFLHNQNDNSSIGFEQNLGQDYGFSVEDVAKIRAKQGRRRLYDSLVRYATDGLDETLKNKVEAFLADIEQFRKESVYTSAADMLDEIFDKYDYIAMVKSLPGGEQRAANMKLLQDSVYQFEAEKKFGVHDFVKYLEGLMTKDFDMG